MTKFVGLCFLVASLFSSGAHAQEVYKTETIVGIGAVLEKLADGTVQVNNLIPNSPAERAGVTIGDIITEVKSQPNSTIADVRSLPLADVVALIRGPIGVPVELTFFRGSSEPIILSIVREKIEIDDGE